MEKKHICCFHPSVGNLNKISHLKNIQSVCLESLTEDEEPVVTFKLLPRVINLRLKLKIFQKEGLTELLQNKDFDDDFENPRS